ncbi:MAG: ribosomal biogenesis protein [Candidatus Methanoplasma sp.]|jgi:nucleolar protein 56|nr:ribosomal biogenesis protein [Candidatus Methanoplasma sp.]
MAVLVTKWFGVFLVNEKNGYIIDKWLMPSDTDIVAAKLAEIQRGAILPEEKELASKADKPSVSERRQSELGRPTLYDSSFITPDKFGFDGDVMHEVMLKLGKLRTSEPIARDKNLVQAIRSLDDLIETANLLNERLHEWYGMHFPELADIAKDDRYSLLIAKHGDRDGIIDELDLGITSIGADFDDDDMKAVTNLADTLCRIYEDKKETESYISEIVSVSCPNMCAILEGPLAARLISLAGGLERLASLPSSTVQLLGAEKAMFRHLRSGKNPPKHGVLYQHPDIHRAPYWQRGNIARALAGKVLIAAKIDAYKGEFKGDVLKAEYALRVKDIKRKYPDPPKKAEKPKGRPNNRNNRNKQGRPRK